MEATFDSTKLTREREVHVVCSVRKVIIDMSSRRATLKKNQTKKTKKQIMNNYSTRARWT